MGLEQGDKDLEGVLPADLLERFLSDHVAFDTFIIEGVICVEKHRRGVVL